MYLLLKRLGRLKYYQLNFLISCLLRELLVRKDRKRIVLGIQGILGRMEK